MAVNSDGVNPTQECKRKKTRCAFVRSLSDVISLVLCFSFLGLFLYIATVRILFIDTVAIASLFVYILGCDAPRFVDGCASVGPRVFPVGRVLGGYITYVPSTE